MNEAEVAYRNAIAELEDAQRRVGAIPKNDPDRAAEREQAKIEFEQAGARVREQKAALHAARTRAAFAGVGSPLHEALVARLDAAIVVELETDALRRQVEREERGAARRAAKAGAAAPSPPAKSERPDSVSSAPPEPPRRRRAADAAAVEVVVRRPGANGSSA